jgi:1-acyl-sn-glycerol-3-phosphate acyltransferase
MREVFSLLYWGFVAATSLVFYPIAVVLRVLTAPFDRNQYLLHRFTCWWARIYLDFLPGCRLRVEGRGKVPPGACVLAPNHQNMSDIMALSALEVPFKWVSKKEIFRIPCIGWNMYLNGYVSVDRGNIRSLKKTLDDCKVWLDRGVPVMMFPEGTRSEDGEIADFHGGPFKLAVEKKCPVVPVVVDGTLHIYEGWSVTPFPGAVTIRVLDPVPATEGPGAVDRLKDKVRSLMVAELAAIRAAKADRAPRTQPA